METHDDELKALVKKSDDLRHQAYEIKVKLSFNEKRIKLIKEEIEALKDKK